jgi:hypothetical protein
MIIFSINIRGVGGAPKLASFKRLLELLGLNILLVQEEYGFD